MKSKASLRFLVGLVVATPLLVTGAEQVPFRDAYPGFNLDLTVQRLVHMEGMDPVWMTELDKARSYSRSERVQS